MWAAWEISKNISLMQQTNVIRMKVASLWFLISVLFAVLKNSNAKSPSLTTWAFCIVPSNMTTDEQVIVLSLRIPSHVQVADAFDVHPLQDQRFP